MKKIYSLVYLTILFVFSYHSGFSQVSTYTFTSSSGSFSSIVNGSGTVVVATTADDDNFGTFPIGFSFVYNGNTYTTFGLNANGFISMGYVPVTTNNALSSGLNNNIIAAFNNDLYGVASNAQISYQTSGSGTSHVLTIEWSNWGSFNGGGGNEFNFQIKLFETTNKIQLIYGSCPGNTSLTLQVGLRGQTNADFNNRTTTSNWSATTAGAVNNSNCTYNSSVKPSSGLKFEWTPVATAKACGTITSVQQTGTTAPGTTGNPILRVDIPVTGNTGTLTLSSITVISKNTTDNDISSAGVKIYTGSSTGPTTQIGSGVSFSGGNATISSLNTSLLTGTNYIWVTFDVSITATIANVLDAKINSGGITITASGGATSPGSQPASNLNPNGNRTVNYCTPVSADGGCVGDQISGFTMAGINYSGGNCVASPGYLDVATTGSTYQGQPCSFTLSCGDVNDYASIWIDYNDNASFDDAGELVYSGGPGTSQGGTFTVPASTPAGTHRVRVRNNYGAAPPSSCGDVTFGETKDFRLTVNAATNCSGAPASSTTLSTANPVCSGSSFTLSLSVTYLNLGITYQWRSSTNGSSYSDISGATNPTYTTTQSSTKYYRCRVTCSISGQSTTSSALQVTQNTFTNCYCIPPASDCSDDKITSVVFAGINNSTTCSANGYGDYTSLTGTTTITADQNISVGVSNGGTEFVSVWIDFDHNGIYDSDERTFLGSGFNQTLSGIIHIPVDAATGATRMRVRLQFAFEPTDPCEEFDYGETEEYTVNINTCALNTYYGDSDDDSYGNASVTIQSCAQPADYVSSNTDCNDNNASIHPNATELCNEIDDNCNDQEDEGLTVFTYYIDGDNDDFGKVNGTSINSCLVVPPGGYAKTSNDCDDNNSSINPGATEVCNSIDDNCNSQVDDGLPSTTFYIDADGDGDGNPSGSAITTCNTDPPSGYVESSGDCDDTDPVINSHQNEFCNGIDDNCNGQIDESCLGYTYFEDADHDGYGNPDVYIISFNQTPPAGYVNNNTDCDDTNHSMYPGADEICNGLDDNCNSQTDEGVRITFYFDGDGDGYGNVNSTYLACVAPNNYVASGTDCNDANAAINPGENDVCNSIDDDCDNVVDENGISATISPSGNVSVCKGTTLVLTANSAAGISYQWIKGSKNIAGATLQTYSPTKSANYKVKETSSFGCPASTSAATSVTILDQPTATITAQGNLDICATGSVVLQANSGTGYLYQWVKGSNNISGATNQNYTATVAATYKVVVTNNSGCSKTSKGKKVTKSCREEEMFATSPATFTLYPNPSDGHFVTELNLQINFSGSAILQVVNTLGQIMFEEKIPMTDGTVAHTIHLNEDAASGIYFVKMIVDDQVFISQLMINK